MGLKIFGVICGVVRMPRRKPGIYVECCAFSIEVLMIYNRSNFNNTLLSK